MSDDTLPPEEIETGEHSIEQGDATDLDYDDEEFHAIVTDPPYNFDGGFMSQEWDDIGNSKQYQLWCEKWASESLRVLKPGGHLVAFSGSTQFHRLMCGIEDAGFDMRETVMWMYGGGFPKSHNIEKAIDKKLNKDDEREVVGEREESSGYKRIDEQNEKHGHRPNSYYDDEPDTIQYTVPASELAKKFEGFGTALKPSFEPIVVARKPLEEDTIAEQVMATGTGGLNIDGTRIPTDEEWQGREMPDADSGNALEGSVSGELNEQSSGSHEQGRFPANVVMDAWTASMLDEEVGESSSVASKQHHEAYGEDSMLMDGESHGGNQYDDSGGPSRFFYNSKASKTERTMNGAIDNSHPTIKPVDLMEWLVKLVTAEEQKVIDPFLGSGTTLLACERANRVGQGVDQSEEYCDLATKRLGVEMGTELGSLMDY